MMSLSEKICVNCARERMSFWIDMNEFEITKAENEIDKTIIYAKDENGRDMQFICDMAGEKELCSYFFERIVALSDEKRAGE